MNARSLTKELGYALHLAARLRRRLRFQEIKHDRLLPDDECWLPDDEWRKTAATYGGVLKVLVAAEAVKQPEASMTAEQEAVALAEFRRQSLAEATPDELQDAMQRHAGVQ